jgi:hypothetical protein
MAKQESPSEMPDSEEIWVCGHTRKCGWRGLESELDWSASVGMLQTRQGICPECGHDEFQIMRQPLKEEPADG